MKANKKYLLLDCTFIIPVKIDSNERVTNLDLVIEHIHKKLKTNIIVVETDITEKVKWHKFIIKIFNKEYDSVYNLARSRNLGIKKSNTKYICICDADTICPISQIIKSVNILKRSKADFVLPYGGKYYNVCNEIKALYKETKNINTLTSNIARMNLIYGSGAVGGIFFALKKAYCDIGMENENFYGWGLEDYERILRCRKMGLHIKRVKGPLFHLEHLRNNHSFYSIDNLFKNKNEYLKICKMDCKDIIEYLNIRK